MERPRAAKVVPAASQEAVMKTEKEKAKEVLKKREMARKGLAEHKDEGDDTLGKQEEREEKIAEAGLAVGLGLRRSG
jgi:hypothetical protein